jgi:hypothetical protein
MLILDEIVGSNKNKKLPKASELIANTHYYIDGQNIVFTEIYHYLKGKCCNNGCKHCAYGYNNKSMHIDTQCKSEVKPPVIITL